MKEFWDEMKKVSLLGQEYKKCIGRFLLRDLNLRLNCTRSLVKSGCRWFGLGGCC